MTFEEVKQSDKLWLTPEEAASSIGRNVQDLRWQAHNNPELLGFPVCVIKTRTMVPRKPFIEFWEGKSNEITV